MGNDIEIKHLTVKFKTADGDFCAVSDVNAVFKEKTITGLVGESGSGKSVLGMSILRLLPKTAVIEGQCMYQGKDLYKISEKEMLGIRGTQIGLIPQNPSESLNPVLKIKRQLTEAVTVHDKSKKAEAAKRSEDLLEKFGFKKEENIQKCYSFQLSGGMNQRVISVLGLMNSPVWLIADEPTKGLDAILRKQVYEVFKRIIQEETSSMLMITHDIILAGKLCDRLMVLYNGVVVEQGETKKVIDDPRHPYTKGLIASLPSKGMVPVQQPFKEREKEDKGCRFYPRCAMACSRCAAEIPGEYKADNGSTVRCFLYDRN